MNQYSWICIKPQKCNKHPPENSTSCWSHWSHSPIKSNFFLVPVFFSDDKLSWRQTEQSVNRYTHLQHENYLWRERKNKLIIFLLSFPVCKGKSITSCVSQDVNPRNHNQNHNSYILIVEHAAKHTSTKGTHTAKLVFVLKFCYFLESRWVRPWKACLSLCDSH